MHRREFVFNEENKISSISKSVTNDAAEKITVDTGQNHNENSTTCNLLDGHYAVCSPYNGSEPSINTK